MNLKQLEAFVKIANNNSFSRTAKELYLTQPTVSAYISSLESELGQKLFARTTKEVELTDAGKRIYLYAREMLELADKIRTAFDGQEDEMKHQIVISASSIPGTYLLPGILAGFSRMYPKTEFRVHETDSLGVVRDITEHRSDIGFTGTASGDRNSTFLPFYEDELVVVTPNTEKYRARKDGQSDADWLARESWIMREEGSGTLRETMKLLESYGIPWEELHVAARFSQTGAILLSVKEGAGIAVVSKLAAEAAASRGEILMIPLRAEGAYRPISMVVGPGYSRNESCRRLVQFVKEMYRK